MKGISGWLAATLVAGMTQAAVAQTEPVQLAAATAQAKKTYALIVYPAGGQTAEQQSRDEQACYGWAREQTGPTTTPDADSVAQVAKAKADSASKGAAMKGAAGGAVGGTLIGAITGNTGRGAGVGAATGALRGRPAKQQAEQQAEQQARAQTEAQAGQQAATFRKAMVACLEGRGYTVQ